MSSSQSWHEVVVECQTRVVRLRAVMTVGGALSPELQRDWGFVVEATAGWVYKRAKQELSDDPDGAQDVLVEVIAQLNHDLHSPGYRSMEAKFGSYISTTTNRILFNLKRNAAEQTSLSYSESLDQPIGENGLERHELVADNDWEQLVEQYQEERLRARLHAAIERLPAIEQAVIKNRLEGVSGKELARNLGMSPPNVTHIYNRALERLRLMLGAEEQL